MVTLREGGQSLDVDAEQLGEGLRLGVTELGELGRDVLHRAVALAQLDAGERRGTGDGDGSRARGIPLALEGGHESRGALGDGGVRVRHLLLTALGEPARPLVGERTHGAAAGVGGEEADRAFVVAG